VETESTLTPTGGPPPAATGGPTPALDGTSPGVMRVCTNVNSKEGDTLVVTLNRHAAPLRIKFVLSPSTSVPAATSNDFQTQSRPRLTKSKRHVPAGALSLQSVWAAKSLDSLGSVLVPSQNVLIRLLID
jgi:hypothetical protein